MIPRGGAYSKRYQTKERERIMQWQAQTARTSRDREHLLSKQTTQRQRALEQRKRAMEQAEEDRRRRALEERRQTQRQATERCKMAISRLRISARSSNNLRHQDTPVEILYTSLPWQAGGSKSSTTPHHTTVSAASLGGGRVVLGAQVEVKQNHAVRRPPALEEVIRSIRGQQSSPKPTPSSASNVPSRPPSVHSRQTNTTAATTSVQSRQTNTTAATTSVQSRQTNTTAVTTSVQSRQTNTTAVTTSVQSRQTNTTAVTTSVQSRQTNTTAATTSVQSRQTNTTAATTSVQSRQTNTTAATTSPAASLNSSKSDPNINTHCPIYKVHHTKVDKQSSPEPGKSPSSKPIPTSTASTTAAHDTSRDPETEGMVFHPVVRGPLKTRVEVSRDAQTLLVVSPTQEDSSSGSCRSPLDSLSGDSSDDGTNTAPGAKRVVRRHKKIVKKENQKKSGEEDSIAAPSNDNPKPSTSATNNVYSDSSSGDESAPAHLSAPRSRRRRKLPPGQTSSEKVSVKKRDETQGPKIVGILKKPRSGGTSTNRTDGREERARVAESVVSYASSTASSVVASERNLLRDDPAGALGRGRVSRDTISMSSASTAKRVRFSDTLESSFNCSQSHSTPHSPAPSSSSNTDLAIERLWKQILQNGTPPSNLPPNGMFNPRMKISLNQKGRGYTKDNHLQREAQMSCDQITVHVPQAKAQLLEDDKFSPPPSSGDGRRKENTGNKNERKEHTPAGFGTVQRQGESFGSVIDDCPTQGICDTSRKGGSEGITPTDKEIDRVWGDIQSELQGHGGEEGRSTVAPQVFQFSPVPQRTGPPAGGRGGRYLPHRPQQKPTTARSQSHTHQKWAGPDKQWPQHHMTYPDTSVQSESSYVVQMSSWEPQQTKQKTGVTRLSHEEQQLMQSLQKINQRLKEHEIAHGPHPSSHYHHQQPATVRTHRKTNNITRHS